MKNIKKYSIYSFVMFIMLLSKPCTAAQMPQKTPRNTTRKQPGTFYYPGKGYITDPTLKTREEREKQLKETQQRVEEKRRIRAKQVTETPESIEKERGALAEPEPRTQLTTPIPDESEPKTQPGTPIPEDDKELTDIQQALETRALQDRAIQTQDIHKAYQRERKTIEEATQREKEEQDKKYQAALEKKRKEITLRKQRTLKKQQQETLDTLARQEFTPEEEPTKHLQTKEIFSKIAGTQAHEQVEPIQTSEEITWTKGSTAYALRRHLQKTPNITTLTCRSIPDEALSVISEECPDLQEIDLSDCTKITADGLYHLRNNKHLKSVNLSRCSNLDNSAMQELVKITSLKLISLAGCTQLTDRDFDVLRKLPNLETLDLTGCTQLTHEDLDVFKYFKRLTRIILTGCEASIIDQAKKIFGGTRIEVETH